MSLSEATSARVNIPGPGSHPAPSGRSPGTRLQGGAPQAGTGGDGDFTPPSWDPAARYRQPCTSLGGSPGSLAAEPRLMLRREVAASPAAGGGCTGTRRGGEGAWRPGPCSRGPARGCHLEARRRSRGTTGGGSGGDGGGADTSHHGQLRLSLAPGMGPRVAVG